jgi:hypothetical protein
VQVFKEQQLLLSGKKHPRTRLWPIPGPSDGQKEKSLKNGQINAIIHHQFEAEAVALLSCHSWLSDPHNFRKSSALG